MDIKEALQKRIADIRAGASQNGELDFSVWDQSETEYLQSIIDALGHGENPTAIHERLQAELPELEEDVAREDASYTFDWYDDHYYNKIYSGRLRACRFALALFEEQQKAE